MWNGRYFTPTSLKQLGLTIQLGHNGAPCPGPMKGPATFTVIHVNGTHDIDVSFCGCSDLAQIPRWRQLMRIGWYPATTSYPKTCATFEALQQCRLLTIHSKLSTFQFYAAIGCLTDDTGLSTPPVCFSCLAVTDTDHVN